MLKYLLMKTSRKEFAPLYKMVIEHENDVFMASSLGKKIAETYGLSKTDETKLVVSIIELTRNIVSYAGKGALFIEVIPNKGIKIIACDKGPGIKNLDDILNNRFRSKTGLGLGLSGVKRLMDEFSIETSNNGTKVTGIKYFRERQENYVGY